ncbi:MAG TPA: ATP-binding protein [Myxococcales bacterium]|jgi:two-component system phosphate regulon sensor histidine kinase PhoR|nr:ATP-binding protein [Myxococcales bacterium]
MRLGLRGRLALAAAVLSALAVAVADAFLLGGLDASARDRLSAGALWGGAAAAVGLSAVAAGLLALRMSRPVSAITAAARRMAQGDLEARSRVGGSDELGELGRALDALAHGLSATLGALRSERDLLGGVLTAMSEGVMMVDAEGKVAMMNRALRQMLLLDSSAVGKRPLEVIRRADLEEILERARRGQEAVLEEMDLPGLKPRRVLVHAMRLDLQSPALLAVLVDVTDLRRLESMRRDFVANVSHELRTPIASVRTAAETLRTAMQKDPVAAQGFVEMVERNADRLHRLVEDLLDLSRIESRELKLSTQTLELGSALEHSAGLFAGRASEKGLKLSVERGERPVLVRADRRALEQVVSNLVDNAVKYCPAGAEIRVRAAPEPGGQQVRVRVEDSGPGIEARHLPRLFERFYRVDPGRSREVGGTGLGLSIVKHLVEAMGGAVDVSSTPGQGTTFSFTLPAA